MNFEPSKILELCNEFGADLKLPSGLSGARLLWGLAGCESSFGRDCTPRHERAFDKGGYFYVHSGEDRQLVQKYGKLAASSYGPWQIMLINAPGCSPDELLSDPRLCAHMSVRFIDSFVVGFRRAKTLEQIAETYNSGNFYAHPPPGVLRYADHTRKYYDIYPSTGEQVKAVHK